MVQHKLENRAARHTDITISSYIPYQLPATLTVPSSLRPLIVPLMLQTCFSPCSFAFFPIQRELDASPHIVIAAPSTERFVFFSVLPFLIVHILFSLRINEQYYHRILRRALKLNETRGEIKIAIRNPKLKRYLTSAKVPVIYHS